MADTVSRVIQPMARRVNKSSPQPAVNNSAVTKILRTDKMKSVRTTPGPSRSFVARHTKTSRSLPAGLGARAQKSERIIAREAPCIRSTRCPATVHKRPEVKMKTWSEIKFFAGFDWAKDHHDVAILDREGKVVSEFRFSHSLQGWEEFGKKIQPFQPLAIVIETNQGIVVDQLLHLDCTVYAINAKCAKRHRECKTVSGSKTDQIDTRVNADALRIQGAQWTPLQPADPLIESIRLLCRDQMRLIEQRTMLVNQMQQALYEYYPAALETFDDWTLESTWDFIIQFPTPKVLVEGKKRSWEKFLHCHHLWREKTAEERLVIFARADKFCGSAPTTLAKSQLAISLAKVLKTLQAQLDQYHKQIEELFLKHPDNHIINSLPGVGSVLGPRLLASLSFHGDQSSQSQILQCLAGTAPVSYISGQLRRCHIRYQCDKFLRQTVHLWSDCSRRKCQWAQTYYQAKREEKKSHACALRCLGQRWLKILAKMWKTKTPYDPELHARNQQQHGSWVLSFVAENKS